MLSEWLRIMLEEIARKRIAAEQALQEQQRRDAAHEKSVNRPPATG